MAKIGRNDPCPCGSGEKYKRCCIDKPSIDSGQKPPSNYDSFLGKYNSLDLLQCVAGVTVLPENHGKYVRLEGIVIKINHNFNSNQQLVSPDLLRGYLSSKYPFHPMEDPPVNLFTDLISFHGGDYLIFPGITENASFSLTNLFSAIYQWPESKLPDQFKTNCYHAALFILGISNRIAKSIEYQRYQAGNTESRSVISIPSQDLLAELKSAVTLTKEEMDRLLNEMKISQGVIGEFLSDVGPEQFADADLEDNPLLMRPLIYQNGNYVVISPATLSLALTKYIWKQAEIWSCSDKVKAAFNDVIWNSVKFQLSQMGFRKLSLEISISASANFRYGFFQFDRNKIAYVQQITDEGQLPKLSNEQVIDELRKVTGYSDFEFLDFTLISPAEGTFYYSLRSNKNAKTLTISIPELDVISNLGDSDAMDLWKFATASEELLKKSKPMNYSFLDYYKFYRDNDESFYSSDSKNDNVIYLRPGYAAEMIFKAKVKKDHHSVPISENGKIFLKQVERKQSYAPVYLHKHDLIRGELQFAVEGFPLAVWVKPLSIPSRPSAELKHILFELTDAISYWLWQIQSGVSSYLIQVDKRSITVTFELSDVKKFENINRIFTRDQALGNKFKVTATSESFNVRIPHEILPYLYGSDNEGERVLVKNLVNGFNEILKLNSLPVIPNDTIDQIIEQNVPRGLKKKFFLLDTNDNLLLDPRNLPEERYVQEYDVNVVLDSIVPGLGSSCPPIGDVTEKTDKEKLAINIVMKVLLPNLKKTISQYDSEELLKELLPLNESLIAKREELRIQTPTRIACFVSVEQQTIDLKINLGKLNRTSLAVRCLIEHIAAEQVKGTNPISTSGIDELIAMMDQIISWGSLGDQIKFDLVEIKIGILPAGRIGTEKSMSYDVFDPYHKSKTVEQVADAINYYDQVYPKQKPIKSKDTPKKLDSAFVADFGISFSRICDFIQGLAIIGLEQNRMFSSMYEKDLQVKINTVVTPFSPAEFNNALEFLSLRFRGDVKKFPAWAEGFDISPWRFNRRLSLLRRPLIVFNTANQDNTLIYWGFRQALSSRIYLADQINTNRLRVSETGNVIKVMGQIAREQGNSLARKVFDKFDTPNFIRDIAVTIAPNGKLYYEKDIGDIDVLAIDLIEKVLYSIECKSLSPSRNIKEMVEEVSKLVGSDSEKGLIKKHTERDDWVRDHLIEIGELYNVNLKDFTVNSFFVTEEDMLTPYLKKLPLPFITLYAIEEKGVAAFRV